MTEGPTLVVTSFPEWWAALLRLAKTEGVYVGPENEAAFYIAYDRGLTTREALSEGPFND